MLPGINLLLQHFMGLGDLQDSELSNEEIMTKVINLQENLPQWPLKAKNSSNAQNFIRISESASNDDNIVLKAHTDGLSFCPQNSSIAGTHYARRVLVLEKLKLYKEALQDIDLALEHPISRGLKNDLEARKQIIQEILEKFPTKDEIPSEKVVLSYGENNSIPGVSAAVAIAFNETDRRHLIATKPIKIGDVLMIQKPYMYLSLQDVEDPNLFQNPSYICHNCLHYSMASIPCENCIRAVYCSKKCRSEAQDKFHNIECKIPTSNEESFNLGLRMLMIITQQGEKLQEVFNLAQELENNPETMNNVQVNQFDPSDLKDLLSLPNSMDKPNYMFAKNAGKIAFELKQRTNIVPRRINTLDLAKFILRLTYIAVANSLKIRRKNNSDIVAFGLYPVFSLMKHSCVANTMMYNDSVNNKIVCAARDIQAGEKITYSVISHQDLLKFDSSKRKNFVRILKKSDCECEACEKNYTFKFELKNKVSVPEDLKTRLRENPKNIEALWELLKLIHDQYKLPCREAKLLELGLLDAFMGKANTELSEVFKVLNII